MTTPAWQAIQPALAPREQFPAAASLRGVTVDAARAIGPPIAGLQVAAAGPEAVFAINAVPFVTVVAALMAWKRPPSTVAATREPFSRSVGTGIRYVRDSKPVRRILLRAALFGFPVSALWALLPLAASKHWHLRAIGYGAVLGTVGAGAVLGVLVMSRLRAAVPSQWVHARGLAMYLVVLIGTQALGAPVWGLVAGFELTASLTTAAVLLTATGVSVVVLPLLPEPGVGHPLPSDGLVS